MATNDPTEIIRQKYSSTSSNAQALNEAAYADEGSGDYFPPRTAALEASGVPPGANPESATEVLAVTKTPVSNVNDIGAIDWRVSLKVPREIQKSAVLRPLRETGNKMVFPFNPTIIFGHTANYDTIHPTHTNYPFNAYQNSAPDQYTISGSFVTENAADAAYWVATIHFLRTMTKMFYGNGNNVGKPPMLSRLNGYGKHVFNNIPVLITNFTTDLPNDVDYIPCNIAGEINYVPTESLITVNALPNYARTSIAKFDLTKFANGDFVNGDEGFI